MRDDLSGVLTIVDPCHDTAHYREHIVHTHSNKLLPDRILPTLKGQNSQMAQISILLRHFIPSVTRLSAPVTTDDNCFQFL